MNSTYRSAVYHQAMQKQVSAQHYMKFFKPDLIGLQLKKLKFYRKVG
jgi:hypothetical protein